MASDPLEAMLAAEDFDLSRYVGKVAFQYDSSEELKQHKRRIQALADQTAQKLKQNVYKNYSLFIDTSKEISSLEAEMYQLSHLLHEHETLTHSQQDVSVSEQHKTATPGESSESHEKHSVASLLETVEGCSTVTEVPGRYLVHSSHIVELDQESYDAIQIVKAFLLNDSLMICSMIKHKKRRGPVRYHFEALYELDNMAVVDVKDSDVVVNTFRILMFPDSHLYQAENEQSKRQWISLLESTKRQYKATREVIRQQAASLKRGNEKEERAARLSLRDPEHQVDLRAAQSADHLRDVSETLDVYIAQREFEQAVKLIEETKSTLKDFSDSHALRDVRARLNHRVDQLCKVLMTELEASPSGSLRGGPRAARRAVGLLLRLGRSAKACELFLDNHSQIIHRDLDDVKMEGTISLYVANLSEVFFAGLKNTALEFVRAFGENHGSYSAFVVWCHRQLQHFIFKSTPAIFSKFSLATVADCMTAILEKCGKLREIGLDLSFDLLGLYYPHLSEALNHNKRQIMEGCGLTGTAETWQPLDLRADQPQLAAIVIEMENLGVTDFKNLIFDGIVDLSGTTVNFCKSVLNLVNDFFGFYVPELLAVFVDCFCDLFQHMVAVYTEALKRDDNLPMVESIRGDAIFLVDTVLPSIGKKINREAGIEIGDLAEQHRRLRTELHQCLRELGSSVEPESAGEEGEDSDRERNGSEYSEDSELERGEGGEV